MQFNEARRSFLTASAAASVLALGGCTTVQTKDAAQAEPEIDRSYLSMYRAMPEERFPIPAVDLSKVDPKFYRRLVDDPTGETPGTIVVDTRSFFLYLVRPGGKALRYGVGLGRAGFEWSGRGVIAWKQKWPKWTPPDEMIERQPELEKYSVRNGGMPPGLTNPLGSRALYIFQDGKDTLYRLHGTPEYWTIGKAVSSGCVRLLNQDVIDLYDRVPNDTPIIVRNGMGRYV
ncbi:L,D-transpeptidase [Nitratireductor rhodophyticola]|uniref:L,D-transpeptidase n=1 Tax=Nitratireductor rhodophyticola TaxID=2854036 RepID=UPI0008140D9B